MGGVNACPLQALLSAADDAHTTTVLMGDFNTDESVGGSGVNMGCE